MRKLHLSVARDPEAGGGRSYGSINVPYVPDLDEQLDHGGLNISVKQSGSLSRHLHRVRAKRLVCCATAVAVVVLFGRTVWHDETVGRQSGTTDLAAIGTANLVLGNLQARYAAAAYCNTTQLQDISSWSKGTQDFRTTKVVDRSDVNLLGFVGHDDTRQTIEIAFRGTHTWANIIFDLAGLPLDSRHQGCSECKVHGGFYTAEQIVLPEVLAAITDLVAQYPTYKVYVTGHSLGGAIAVLAALDLVYAGIQNVECVTFGAPRVGNAAWADHVQLMLPTALRYTHARDIVVHLPPKDLGYLHNPTEVFEPPDGDVRVCEDSGSSEDPTCSDRYPWLICNIEDHLVYLGIHITHCEADDVQPGKRPAFQLPFPFN